MDRELKLQLLSTSSNKDNKGNKRPRLHAGWVLRQYNTEEEVEAIKAKLPKKKKVIKTLKTFPAARWVPLVPNSTAINKPANPTFKAPRAPIPSLLPTHSFSKEVQIP